jgi:molybdopterin-guanine dinucleotide biosynthesis protein A
MGRDKAWIELDGQPLIARLVSLLRSLNVAELFISGRSGTDYGALGCPVLLDLEPGFGPMGGIERGLHASQSPLVLVTAVDLAHLNREFLSRLIARCDRLTGAVPKLRGELEPLAAIYPKRCHELAAHAIFRSRYSARDFAQMCLTERAVRTFHVGRADAACFANWNRPADALNDA